MEGTENGGQQLSHADVVCCELSVGPLGWSRLLGCIGPRHVPGHVPGRSGRFPAQLDINHHHSPRSWQYSLTEPSIKFIRSARALQPCDTVDTWLLVSNKTPVDFARPRLGREKWVVALVDGDGPPTRPTAQQLTEAELTSCWLVRIGILGTSDGHRSCRGCG